MNFTYKLLTDPNQVLRSDGARIARSNQSDWQLYQVWLFMGNTPESADVITPAPNWDGLRDRLLTGNLSGIFQRVTATAIAPDANAVSTARSDIINAILSVKQEAALASGLGLLTGIAEYVFTTEEKILWNTTMDDLHFSELVKLL